MLFGKVSRALSPSEFIYSDICEPMNVKAHHGVTNYSQYRHVYLSCHHYWILYVLKYFAAEVETQLNKKLELFKSIEIINLYLIC